MEQDLTGYKTPPGTLVYGSEEDDIYYFVKTKNNLWLYNIERVAYFDSWTLPIDYWHTDYCLLFLKC